MLNEGFLAHLQAADRNADFSEVCRFYILKKAKIDELEAKKKGKTASKSSDAAPSSNVFSRSSAAAQAPKPAAPSKSNGVDLTKSLFGHHQPDAQTPKPASTTGLFTSVPATAPVKKRGIQSDEDDAPLTEKRRKSGDALAYPKVSSSTGLFGTMPSTAPTKKRTEEDDVPATEKREKSGAALEYPKPTPSTGLFGTAPSAAPTKKRSVVDIEDDDVPAAATEKRRKSNEAVEYPKLSASASNTAKLFEAALDKPADVGAAAKSLFASKPAEQAHKPGDEAPKPSMFGGFKPSTSSLFSPKPTNDAPKAATSASSPTPAAAKPAMPKPAAAGGFMPTFAAPPAGGSNFLSAFGQNASKAQDAARQKAMDEDFDSEDDDPEEWKKNYEEKQAAKRKAIEEAAKSGGGFSMKAASGPSDLGGKKDEATASGPSFQDRAKKDEAAAETPAADKTWKQGTPIKFGADTSTPAAPLTAPPKGTGLFGSSTGFKSFGNAGSSTPMPSSGTSLFSQTQKTQSNGASLFSFTSKSSTESSSFPPPKAAEPAQPSAEATTTTPTGEETADPDDEAGKDPQVEDMTALQASEKEESDVLYHVAKAKSYKFETKANAEKPEWTYKALGPVWLLRNKTTGKVRLLQKVAPLGKAGMNFNVLTVASMYAQQGKRVTASFVDHINETEPKKPTQWYVQFGSEDDAKELARLMKEEAEKQ